MVLSIIILTTAAACLVIWKASRPSKDDVLSEAPIKKKKATTKKTKVTKK